MTVNIPKEISMAISSQSKNGLKMLYLMNFLFRIQKKLPLNSEMLLKLKKLLLKISVMLDLNFLLLVFFCLLVVK